MRCLGPYLSWVTSGSLLNFQVWELSLACGTPTLTSTMWGIIVERGSEVWYL